METVFYTKMMVFKFCILLSFTLMIAARCPVKEDIYPCTCFSSPPSPSKSYTYVGCSHIQNHNVLHEAVHAMKNMKIDGFTIHNGLFLYIPHNIFKENIIYRIYIGSTTFMALTDKDIAFEGIEGSLTSLSISNCQMYSQWNWSVLRKLSNLKNLDIHIGMETVSKDIKEVYAPHLEKMILNMNKINHIHKEAFSSFKMIEEIDLHNNLISEVKRSMMPTPASFLRLLNLDGNKIRDIPLDMFEDMPALRSFHLRYNRILTLNEKAFSNALKTLGILDVNDNPLVCDCRLSWIINSKYINSTRGNCNKPKRLKGKSLIEIRGRFLMC